MQFFFKGFWVLGPCPRPCPGLGIEFPMPDGIFGCVFAELCNFLWFLPGLESCEPLFDDLGFLFYDFQTWEGLLKRFEKVLKGSEKVWKGLGTLSLIVGSGVVCFGFGAVIKLTTASGRSPGSCFP